MATQRYYFCSRCETKTSSGSLLQALLDFSRTGPPICEHCRKRKELRLVFRFGLEAGQPECRVIQAFLPEDPVSWKTEDRKTVTFLPFLVVLQKTDDEGQAIWLPYWHTVVGHLSKEAKYGQWAPWMDADLFKSLVGQARQKGYL